MIVDSPPPRTLAPPVADPGPPVAAPGPVRSRHRSAVLLCSALLVACFGLALVTRLVGLDVALTADEPLWMQRSVRFGTAVLNETPIATYGAGHPGVTVMWAGFMGLGPERTARASADRYHQLDRLTRAPEFLSWLSTARTSVTVAVAGLVALLVLLAVKLFGPGPGLVGGLLLLLDPYVVGSTRVLHVDALLAPLMAVSALAGLLYWTGARRRRYLVLSATAGSLALLTKTPAVFVGLYFGLLALATARPWTAPRAAGALPILLWGFIAAAVYFAAWPAMWADPLTTARDVLDFVRATGGTAHLSGNYFFGQPLDDPGPLFYPVALAFRLGPIASIGLLALALPQRSRPRWGVPVAWLLVYVVLFVLMLSLGAKKLDRYLLPAILVLDLVAGVGLWHLARRLRPGRPANLGLALAVAVQAAVLCRAYPYPIAAYNPLLGGTAGAEQAIMLGWGEGLDQVAAYLNARPDAKRLNVVVHYPYVLRPLVVGSAVPIAPYLHEGPGIPRPPIEYFLVYVNAAQRERIPPLARVAMEHGPPEFTAYVHGQPYAWLYPAPDFGDHHADKRFVPGDEDEDEP